MPPIIPGVAPGLSSMQLSDKFGIDRKHYPLWFIMFILIIGFIMSTSVIVVSIVANAVSGRLTHHQLLVHGRQRRGIESGNCASHWVSHSTGASHRVTHSSHSAHWVHAHTHRVHVAPASAHTIPRRSPARRSGDVVLVLA